MTLWGSHRVYCSLLLMSVLPLATEKVGSGGVQCPLTSPGQEDAVCGPADVAGQPHKDRAAEDADHQSQSSPTQRMGSRW